MTDWPYPGDGPTARARRVAHAYRALAERHIPRECGQLDAQMIDMGQRWVVPAVITFEPGEWLSAAQAADLMCVELAAIRQLRRRGLLAGEKVGDRWRYRAGDVERAFARPRGRTGTVTDTMAHSAPDAPGNDHEGHR